MNIHTAVLIKNDDGVSFGVVLLRRETIDRKGTTTEFVIHEYRMGENPVAVPVREDQITPIKFVALYGDTKTFFESHEGFLWAKAEENRRQSEDDPPEVVAVPTPVAAAIDRPADIPF